MAGGFHFIEGLMGGGKSYHGAELCYQALKEGAIVHTNIPLKWDSVEANGWADRVVILTGVPSDWVTKVEVNGKKTWQSSVFVMGREGAENVVVVDEAAIEVSADDQGTAEGKKNNPLFGLVALSRHAGLEIYFLAQRMHHVAKKVRDLAETRTICENCEKVPYIGWYLKRFHGDLRRTIWKDGKVYGSCYLRLKKEICGFYETHGMRDSLAMKSGGERVKKASEWTRKGVFKIVGMLVLGIGLMTFGLWRGTSMYQEKTQKKPVREAEMKKVDRIAADGSTHQIDVAVKPPAPKGGILLEWDAYDEHQLAGVHHKGGTTIVMTRGGRRLYAGGSYEGQRIDLQFCVADWHYFLTVSKRVIVVRPLRPEERATLQPVTIVGRTGSVDQKVSSPVDDVLSKFNSPLP